MAGTTYPLEKAESYIGRDLTNDIVINDPEVSRRHARIYIQGPNFIIEDLGSTNGTSINGQRIVGAHVLRPGELVMFGEHISLLFESMLGDPDATIASASARPVMPPRQPVAPAYTPPPPAYNPPPPSYSGQIPAQPVVTETVVDNRRGVPLWLLVLGILLIIICVCAVALFAVDSLNLWCSFFGWFFGPEACP